MDAPSKSRIDIKKIRTSNQSDKNNGSNNSHTTNSSYTPSNFATSSSLSNNKNSKPETLCFVKFEGGEKIPSLSNLSSSEACKYSTQNERITKLLERKEANDNQKKSSKSKKVVKNLLGIRIDDDSDSLNANENKKSSNESCIERYERIYMEQNYDKKTHFDITNELNPDETVEFNQILSIITKMNHHNSLSKFKEEFDKKLKISTLVRAALNGNRSLSNRFAMFEKHNQEVFFSVIKQLDIKKLFEGKQQANVQVVEKEKESQTTVQNTEPANNINTPSNASCHPEKSTLNTSSTSTHSNLNLFDELCDFENFLHADKDLFSNICYDLNDKSSSLAVDHTIFNNQNTRKPENMDVAIVPPEYKVVPEIPILNHSNSYSEKIPITKEAFDQDPRYIHVVSSFISLVMDLLNRLCVFNLQQVNICIQRSHRSTNKPYLEKLNERKTKILKDLCITRKEDNNHKLFGLSLNAFLRNSKITSLPTNIINYDYIYKKLYDFEFKKILDDNKYHLTLNDYSNMLKNYLSSILVGSLGKVNSSINYFLTEIRLFVSDLLTDIFLDTTATAPLETDLFELIKSIIKPITLDISHQTSLPIEDPRVNHYTYLNRVPVDLQTLTFKMIIDSSKDSFVGHNEKNYKKQKYSQYVKNRLGMIKYRTKEIDKQNLNLDIQENKFSLAAFEQSAVNDTKAIPLDSSLDITRSNEIGSRLTSLVLNSLPSTPGKRFDDMLFSNSIDETKSTILYNSINEQVNLMSSIPPTPFYEINNSCVKEAYSKESNTSAIDNSTLELINQNQSDMDQYNIIYNSQTKSSELASFHSTPKLASSNLGVTSQDKIVIPIQNNNNIQFDNFDEVFKVLIQPESQITSNNQDLNQDVLELHASETELTSSTRSSVDEINHDTRAAMNFMLKNVEGVQNNGKKTIKKISEQTQQPVIQNLRHEQQLAKNPISPDYAEYSTDEENRAMAKKIRL